MASGFGNIVTQTQSRGGVVGPINNVQFTVGWDSSSGVAILVGTYAQWGLQSGGVTDNEVLMGTDDNTSFERSSTQSLDTDQLYQWRGLTINVDTGQTRTGSTENFKTYAQNPTCPTPSASSITGSSATIAATGYALNVTTSTGTAYLQYKAASSGTWITATYAVASSGNLSANLTSLSLGTTYDVRVLIERNTENVTSIAGTTYQFTTTSPTATSAAATSVGGTTATLNGSYNAVGAVGGDPLTVRFEYGTTTGLGTNVTVASATGTGSVSTSTNLTGLALNTTYYFRIRAFTSTADVAGSTLSFTTSTPTASTSAATAVEATTATLNGSYNAAGAVIGAPVTVRFDWGPTISYGNSTTITTTATGSGSVNTSTNVTGLTANTLYYFRIYISYSTGSADGGQLSFTTLTGQSTMMVF